jgi:hypothetical protein
VTGIVVGVILLGLQIGRDYVLPTPRFDPPRASAPTTPPMLVATTSLTNVATASVTNANTIG